MEQEKVTVSFFLDASRPSSEGQCLIKLNIYQRPTKKRYATKYHATPDEWKKITSSNLRDDELKKIVEKELKNFSIDLNKKIEKQSKDFKDEMSEIVSTYQRYVDELVEHYAKSVKFEFDFQPNIKIKRNINIGNVLMALLGDIIGIISTALNMSNPVGWVILGLSVLSTFFHVYKIVRGAIDKNFQKSQQRKNADENIEKVVKTIQQELGKYLIETMSEVNKHLAELTKLMYEPVWQIKSMSETFIEVENELKFLSNELDKKGEKYYGNS